MSVHWLVLPFKLLIRWSQPGRSLRPSDVTGRRRPDEFILVFAPGHVLLLRSAPTSRVIVVVNPGRDGLPAVLRRRLLPRHLLPSPENPRVYIKLRSGENKKKNVGQEKQHNTKALLRKEPKMGCSCDEHKKGCEHKACKKDTWNR